MIICCCKLYRSPSAFLCVLPWVCFDSFAWRLTWASTSLWCANAAWGVQVLIFDYTSWCHRHEESVAPHSCANLFVGLRITTRHLCSVLRCSCLWHCCYYYDLWRQRDSIVLTLTLFRAVVLTCAFRRTSSAFCAGIRAGQNHPRESAGPTE